MPSVDAPWKGLCFFNVLFFSFDPLFPCLPYQYSFLASFIFPFLLVPPFLFVCVAPAVSVWGLLFGQFWQSNKPRVRHRLDTQCIQLTRHNKAFPIVHTKTSCVHAIHTHTHAENPPLTDLTPPPTFTFWTPLQSVSTWQISTVLNIPNYLLQVSSEGCSQSRFTPPLRKHKKKMISFQLDQAQGNFPAVFTHSNRYPTRAHMWGAEELSSGALVSLSWRYKSGAVFSIFPLLRYAFLVPKMVTLVERGETFPERGS